MHSDSEIAAAGESALEAKSAGRWMADSEHQLPTFPHARVLHQAPDPAAEAIAATIIGATHSEEDLSKLLDLVRKYDIDGLRALIDSWKGRMTKQDSEHWRYHADLVEGVALALLQELTGATWLRSRRNELKERLSQEEFERAQGYEHQPTSSTPKVAIRIRCAGNVDGRNRDCGKVRCYAYALPDRRLGDPVLLIANEGKHRAHPLLESLVPADFSGSTPVVQSFRCDDHNWYTFEDPTQGEVETQGDSVGMPHHLLEAPYKWWLARGGGQPEELRWAPEVGPTVLRRR